MKKVLLSLCMCCAVVLPFIMIGCVPGYKYVEKITLNKGELTLTVGDTFTLVATVTPADAIDAGVEWESENGNIVSVNGGHITAVCPGEVTITAIAGSHTATCKVVVKERINNISGKTYVYESFTYTIDPSVPENMMQQYLQRVASIESSYANATVQFKADGNYTEIYKKDAESNAVVNGTYLQEQGNITMTPSEDASYGIYSATTIGNTLTLTVQNFHSWTGLTCVFTMTEKVD